MPDAANPRARVAVLISGRGSNMAALLAAAADPAYPAEVVLVLANKAGAGGLEMARAAGVATAVVESRGFKGDRAGFEAAVQAELERHGVELVALAWLAAGRVRLEGGRAMVTAGGAEGALANPLP